MNDRFDLRIITQRHSQVYWGYFRRLVFGNSSTKHNKLTYFSNSMLFCSDVLLPFSHIPRCIHAKTPNFPRLFEPRVYGVVMFLSRHLYIRELARVSHPILQTSIHLPSGCIGNIRVKF